MGQVVGAQSLQALWDRERDDPRAAALPVVLAALVAIETWLATEQPLGGDLPLAGLHLIEAYVDRGYLNSSLVRDRPADLQIYCIAWPVRNGTKLTKSAFTLDWEREQLTCPN